MTDLLQPSQNGEREVDEAFRSLVLDASLTQDNEGNPVVDVLEKHLGKSPFDCVQINETHHQRWKHVIVQAGLDAFLSAEGRTHEIVGVSAPVGDPRFCLSQAKLFTAESLSWAGVTLGSATWEQLRSGYDDYMRCLFQGMILIKDAEGPIAIWVTTYFPYPNAVYRDVTVTTPDSKRALAINNELRRLGEEHSPYAGQMLRLGGAQGVEFLQRPAPMTSDDVIMPPGLLERIDAHAIGITKGARRLAEAGQHLKRGLLLYGPPGTGKTHTLRYLASNLPAETTVMAIDPRRLWWLEPMFPYTGGSAMVILDDIDQIATDRALPGARDSLFELLETLDGLQGFGDMLFVLTTNRLDALEPAVSARPGRIDEALEVPRPDADCRRRLFQRYREGMNLTVTDEEIDEIVKRTEGSTGSFPKELFRRSTVIAVERGGELGPDGLVPVTGVDLFKALDEMLDPNNPATRLLLGAAPEHAIKRVAVVTEAAK